jgi:hypothetical protein
MSLINIQGGFNLTGAAAKVARYYNLGNVAVINANNNNPYLGKLPTPITKDEPRTGAQSFLGTPVFSNLVLNPVEPYTDFLGNQFFPYGKDILLNTVIITVDQPIRIIKTEIQGRDGTVKEYIGKDDAKITINGIITGANGVYPYFDVQMLKTWLDAPTSKGITAWWLDLLNITQMVVESYSFPQAEGGYSYQMFSIQAISDNPVELKITQSNV